MTDERLCRRFGEKRLSDRQLDELIGLVHGIIADGEVNDREVEYLKKWLVANIDVLDSSVAQRFLARVDDVLSGNTSSTEAVSQLYEALQNFVGGDFELGEVLKSGALPLDIPAPEIVFPGNIFCFTGDFTGFTRGTCEQAVECRGAKAGSLTKRTNYLVVATYATGSWKHSSFGNKIERAVELKSSGHRIHIVGEIHWREALDAFPPIA